IREIKAEKIEKRILPDYALEIEILSRNKTMTVNQLHVQARMLSGAGRIKIGQTLNSTYYQLLEGYGREDRQYEPADSV
ncbi:MAG: hypothetical protein ACI4RI_05220, partial [Ruminococcus sp.]